jgi:hypothetical protein
VKKVGVSRLWIGHLEKGKESVELGNSFRPRRIQPRRSYPERIFSALTDRNITTMIQRFFKLPFVRITAVIYAVLWLLTVVFGNSSIDREFDAQLRYGHPNMNSDERVEITRIKNLYVRDLLDPRNESLIPSNGLFRYRSSGIAVAPFVVVDEIGTIFAPLGGIGGIRLNLWFFGPTKTWIVYSYWNA